MTPELRLSAKGRAMLERKQNPETAPFLMDNENKHKYLTNCRARPNG